MAKKLSARLSPAAREVVRAAQDRAGAMGSDVVRPGHLFLALLDSENDILCDLFTLNGLDHKKARIYAQSTLEPPQTPLSVPPIWERETRRLFPIAEKEARGLMDGAVEPAHLLIALSRPHFGASFPAIARALGLDFRVLRAQSVRLRPNLPYPVGSPLNNLAPDAREMLTRAETEMRATFCGRVDTLHLLLAFLRDENGPFFDSLQTAGLDAAALKRETRAKILSDDQLALPQPRLTDALKAALDRAQEGALRAGRAQIRASDLFAALLPQPAKWGEKPTSDEAAALLRTFLEQS